MGGRSSRESSHAAVRNDDNEEDNEDAEDGNSDGDDAGVAQNKTTSTINAETLPPINKRNSLRRFFSLIVVVSSAT